MTPTEVPFFTLEDIECAMRSLEFHRRFMFETDYKKAHPAEYRQVVKSVRNLKAMAAYMRRRPRIAFKDLLRLS